MNFIEIFRTISVPVAGIATQVGSTILVKEVVARLKPSELKRYEEICISIFEVLGTSALASFVANSYDKSLDEVNQMYKEYMSKKEAKKAEREAKKTEKKEQVNSEDEAVKSKVETKKLTRDEKKAIKEIRRNAKTVRVEVEKESA